MNDVINNRILAGLVLFSALTVSTQVVEAEKWSNAYRVLIKSFVATTNGFKHTYYPNYMVPDPKSRNDDDAVDRALKGAWTSQALGPDMSSIDDVDRVIQDRWQERYAYPITFSDNHGVFVCLNQNGHYLFFSEKHLDLYLNYPESLVYHGAVQPIRNSGEDYVLQLGDHSVSDMDCGPYLGTAPMPEVYFKWKNPSLAENPQQNEAIYYTNGFDVAGMTTPAKYAYHKSQHPNARDRTDVMFDKDPRHWPAPYHYADF